jgi:hypothetical protein
MYITLLIVTHYTTAGSIRRDNAIIDIRTMFDENSHWIAYNLFILRT